MSPKVILCPQTGMSREDQEQRGGQEHDSMTEQPECSQGVCETLAPSPSLQKKKRKPERRTYIYRPRRSARCFYPAAERQRKMDVITVTSQMEQAMTRRAQGSWCVGELGGNPRSLKEPSTPLPPSPSPPLRSGSGWIDSHTSRHQP